MSLTAFVWASLAGTFSPHDGAAAPADCAFAVFVWVKLL